MAIPAILLTKNVTLLAELHRQCFDVAWNEADFAEMLAVTGTYAAIAGKKCQGLILWRHVFEQAEILTLGVLPEFRGHGVGGYLLQYAAAQARAEGVETLFLEVAIDNSSAIKLYERSGFDSVAVRKNYYRKADGWVDAKVMHQTLKENMR